jgi:hypothetical protein
MDSVDAEQCYDAVSHACASIGLQTYGMPIEYVKTYLTAMAHMVYHVKTGFKRDEEGFAGTIVNCFNGLGQGSGGAPPVWQVVSSLMIGAYRREGYLFCLILKTTIVVQSG